MVTHGALKHRPTDEGHFWFEYAAVLLLSGDRTGYTKALLEMVEKRSPKTRRSAAYHIARVPAHWLPMPSAEPVVAGPPRRIGTAGDPTQKILVVDRERGFGVPRRSVPRVGATFRTEPAGELQTGRGLW